MKKVVYLGPQGSYTEVATEKILTSIGVSNFELENHNSILKIINIVNSNPDYIGVVPVENSFEGIVRETVDNLFLTRPDLYITKEVVIPISHCLISKSNNIKNITKVVSMVQALAQCQHYLVNSFPDRIELITSTSTSQAVSQLNDLPDNYAAIGNSKAAEIYNLNIIDRNINDIKDNKTRFICIESSTSCPTGNDKTSIAFSTCNKPGALVDILISFKQENINMSYIESRPSKRSFGEYTYFVDFDGHIEDEKVKKAINKIIPFVHDYKFFGSYPKYTD